MAAQSTDERALRRLIKRTTASRDWQLLELLFINLGMLFEEQESRSPGRGRGR